MMQLKEKGFSLIELMVTMGIVSFALLVASSLVYIGGAYTLSLTEEFAAIENAYKLEYQLRKVLSLAVRVDSGGPRANNYEGRLLDVNCTTRALCDETQWQEVGYFLHENSTGGLDLGAGQEEELTQVYIWYKGPRHDVNGVNSTTGVLVIPQWSFESGTPIPGPNPGTPTVNDFHVGQISSFQTEVTRLANAPQGQGVSKVKFSISFRYHGVTDVKSWCSRTDLNAGVCNFNGGEVPNYYDLDREFTIPLVNNILLTRMMDGSGLESRVLGPIHFFRPLFPTGAN